MANLSGIWVWPFLVQGLVLAVDEFYCHRRRELGRWERLGHPLDTASFALALTYLIFSQPSPTYAYSFGFLALVSCVLITKDEWEHKLRCNGFECWLHAILFVVHPIVLLISGFLWWERHILFIPLVGGTAILAWSFFVYQVLYWNVYGPEWKTKLWALLGNEKNGQ